MLTGFVQDVCTAFQFQSVHDVVTQTAAAEHRQNFFLSFFKVSSTVINPGMKLLVKSGILF